MKPYGVGLIGLGVISKYFVSAVEKNKSTLLQAVCARSALSRSPFEKKGIKGYEKYENLIADDKVEFVIVATPNNTHFDIIKKALRAGKHVICEKPLALLPAEARYLIKLAQKQDLLLMTIFHRRYNSQIIDLFKPAKKGKRIRAIYARYLEHIPDHSGQATWYYDIRESGGGCVIDNGINVIDAVRQMVGDIKLTQAHVGMRGNGKGRHDANAFLTYEFAGGQTIIELDWYYQGEVKDFVIYFDDGTVERRNMLEGSSEFKGSLWHEYEATIQEVVARLNRHDYTPDDASLRALEAVTSVYKKTYITS